MALPGKGRQILGTHAAESLCKGLPRSEASLPRISLINVERWPVIEKCSLEVENVGDRLFFLESQEGNEVKCLHKDQHV